MTLALLCLQATMRPSYDQAYEGCYEQSVDEVDALNQHEAILVVGHGRVTEGQHQILGSNGQWLSTVDLLDGILERTTDNGTIFLESCYGGAIAPHLTEARMGSRRLFAFSPADEATLSEAHYTHNFVTAAIHGEVSDYMGYSTLYPGELTWYEGGICHRLSSYQLEDGHIQRTFSTLDTEEGWQHHGEPLLASADSESLGNILLATTNSSTEKIDLINALIERGANLETSTRNGTTPLAIAAKNGHKEAVKSLLKAGANPDLPTNILMQARNPLATAITNARNAINSITCCLEILDVTVCYNQEQRTSRRDEMVVQIEDIRKLVGRYITTDNDNPIDIGDVMDELKARSSGSEEDVSAKFNDYVEKINDVNANQLGNICTCLQRGKESLKQNMQANL